MFGLLKKKYKEEEVLELIQLIKEFNAGAVDTALDRHIDKCLKEWKEAHGQ